MGLCPTKAGASVLMPMSAANNLKTCACDMASKVGHAGRAHKASEVRAEWMSPAKGNKGINMVPHGRGIGTRGKQPQEAPPASL